MNEWDYWFEFDFQLLPYFCEWYCKKLGTVARKKSGKK